MTLGRMAAITFLVDVKEKGEGAVWPCDSVDVKRGQGEDIVGPKYGF